MKVETKHIEVFQITLNIDEVRILKELTQNPYLYLTNPQDEPKDMGDFREYIWKTFKDIR